MAFLTIRDLQKSFGAKTVLRGVTFSAERGEILSVIGPSGGGKTTLLRCLSGIEKPSGGTVTLTGGEGEGTPRVGLVFQSYELFPQYTARDNIRMPLLLTEKRRKRRGLPPLAENPDAYVDGLLAKMDLSRERDLYPWQLSGGQKQRVAIARSLAQKPDLLCFDEPTSALDPDLKREFADMIRSLRAESLMTVLVVTHDLSLARAISDRVVFLSGGCVVESGTPEEIFANPRDPRTRALIASENI